MGKGALATLRRAANGSDARRRTRARSILTARERHLAARRLSGYGCSKEVDIERGLFLLGRLERPDLDTRPYVKALDAMAAEVTRRVARESDDFARPMVLSQVLGNELGFIGCEVDYDHPDNIHLHRAIERKRGMPLTLTAIYLCVARRAGLRAAALALPGHVLLRLYAGQRSMIVDPFRGGRMRTRADCVRYLAQNGLVPRPDWFHDCPDRLLLRRHVRNLMNSMQVRGLTRAFRDLQLVDRVLGSSSSNPVPKG